MRKSRSIAISAAVCSFGLLTSQSRATDYSWTSAISGNWNDTTLWTPSGAFPVAGDTATFNAAGANGGETISLTGNQAAASLTFTNPGGTGLSTDGTNNRGLTLTNGITVNNGAGAVAIGSNTANNNVPITLSGSQTFTNNSTSALSFGNGGTGTTPTNNTDLQAGSGTNVLTLAGSGNFLFSGSLKNGAGSLALNVTSTGTVELDGAASQFAGGVTLNSGTLGLKSSNALGTSVGSSITINGGTFNSVSAGRDFPANVSVTLNGDCTFGTGTLGGNASTFEGAITFNNVVNLACLNTLRFLGTVVGPGGFTKTDTGANVTTITLAGSSNTYSGPTKILSGTLAATTSNSFSPNSQLILASQATVNIATSGSAETIGSLSDGGGVGGTIPMGNLTGVMMNLGGDNTSTTFSGVFSGSDTNNNGGIIKAGTGTFTLTGANTFNGSVKVNNGAIAFNTIGNVGAAASALMAPANAAIGVISLGSGATTGTLQYIGSSLASTDRVIDLAGTSGGAGLDSSGTAPISYVSNFTASGIGAKSLTLSGSNLDNNIVSGVVPDSGGGATSLVKAGPGKWVLSAANTYSGGTTVSAGTLAISNVSALGTGSIAVTGGTASVTAGLSTAVRVSGVAVTGGALDMNDNDMIVDYSGSSPASAIAGYLKTGFNNGAWNGGGIDSSTAAGDATMLTALGYADVSNTTFDGQSIPGNAIIVKYTYYGDNNLDGVVTTGDFSLLLDGLATGGSVWSQGDYTYDGKVDLGNDVNLFLAAYLHNGGALGDLAPVIEANDSLSGAQKAQLLAAVPEPMSLGLLGIAGCAIALRRRRS